MNRVHLWLCRSPMWRMALEQKLLPWVLNGLPLGEDLLEVGAGSGVDDRHPPDPRCQDDRDRGGPAAGRLAQASNSAART